MQLLVICLALIGTPLSGKKLTPKQFDHRAKEQERRQLSGKAGFPRSKMTIATNAKKGLCNSDSYN